MKLTMIVPIVALLGLTACGSSTGERALSGGGIGAGIGALGGAVTGGSPLTGAIIGGAVGAGTGALTDSDDIDFSRDRDKRRHRHHRHHRRYHD